MGSWGNHTTLTPINQRAMTNTVFTSTPEATERLASYPPEVQPALQQLRALILKTAEEIEDLTELTETLKWSEPSYVTKHGSTLRMDWKAKTPDQYALYFSCSSQLVPTFRVVFQDLLTFEGKRAILFRLGESLPEDIVKQCIRAALTYQRVKQLPLLGL